MLNLGTNWSSFAVVLPSSAIVVDFLVAIERSGPSLADNKCRSMRGIDLSMHCADLHLLFERAAEFHVGTIVSNK